MRVEVVKVLVLFSLLIMTFILGIIPLFLKTIFNKRAYDVQHKRRYKMALSFLSCYAAGVFLATGVLDLLPSVRVDLGMTLNSMNVFTSFPVAEFVMMFGLFVILIVEQIVLTLKERHSNEPLSEKVNVKTPLLSSSETDQDVMTRSYSHSISSQHSIGGINDEPFQCSFPGSSSTRRHCDECEENVSVSQRDINSLTDTNEELLPEHEHSSVRSLLLITALSLHSIFEGLAVGLQEKAEDVLSIFAALVIHKSILSFSLGMNLIQSKLKQGGIIKSIVIFSLTSPIGIAIGIGIVDLSADSQQTTLVQGLLTGIACGTFLYVVFFEVLPCEFNTHDHRLLKVLFLLLGFGTVTGVLFLQKDDGPTCFVVSPTNGNR